MKKAFTLIAFLSIIISLKAQIKYDKRIEFELDDDYYSEVVTPMGNKGFLLTAFNKKKRRGSVEQRYQLYNSALELEESQSFFMDKKFYQDSQTETDDALFTLFKKKDDFILVSYQTKSKEITKVSGKLPKKFNAVYSDVIGDYFYATGSIKRELAIFRLNWKTGETKIVPLNVPGAGKNPISILDFQTLNKSKELFIYIKENKGKGESMVHVFRFKEDGTKIEQYVIEQQGDKNIVSLSSSKLEDGSHILTGTYSTSSVYSSEGIFFAKIRNQRTEYINYHKFLDLNNFLNYLPEKRQEKIEKKKEKKKRKGKEYTLSYNIINHDVIQRKDGYVFLGEAYYPTYRTYTTTSTVNGVTTTTTHTVFDGYQYTHAVVAKFDINGKLIWDECFEMAPTYKPFRKIKFISIAEENQSEMKMVFASRNTITSKSISFSSGEIVNDEKSEPIETFDGDKKIKFSHSFLNYWYDNHFLSYGIQRIKSKESGKRTVFFISKITY